MNWELYFYMVCGTFLGFAFFSFGYYARRREEKKNNKTKKTKRYFEYRAEIKVHFMGIVPSGFIFQGESIKANDIDEAYKYYNTKYPEPRFTIIKIIEVKNGKIRSSLRCV